MTLRRISARRKRQACKAVWPILPGSETPPEGWTCWPDRKKFSFVITHDVEGPEGLAKCRRLAELEMSLGFRSSFNFIPEGSYTVPASLRTWLTQNGFEVGVHDLYHDGKLYFSRKQFTENAQRINGYMKEWGAVGYRSGFMLRNLEWHHDINAEYDATTFDTDPFEPQPGGAGTIFPFWVLQRGKNPARGAHDGNMAPKGYVELPYTLPQDSTLFLLFREKTNDIWVRKLDWIAQQGGMALVNVHPDYLCFDDEKPSASTFPADLYAGLLQRLRLNYADQYWNPLPRELSGWYRTTFPIEKQRSSSPFPNRPDAPASAAAIAGLRGKRAAVLLYSRFPQDPRPCRAALAMVEAGMEVDMFCLADKENDPLQETLNGVKVVRVQIQHRRNSGALMYFIQYGRFILSAFWFLTSRGLKKKYDLIHVHNMPDVLVFSALVPKLQGSRVILDLHDPMPELMMTIYNVKPGSVWVTVLKLLEKLSMLVANSVVTVNEACRIIFASRSCPLEKVHVVMNAPDETIFRPRAIQPSVRGKETPFVIMYHGSLVHRHGLDLAVTALATVKPILPNAVLHVYGGSNAYLDEVLESAAKLGVRDSVVFLGSKSQREIVDAINQCDVGIIPNRRSIFTELNTPTRIFEYLSQSKPVIAPRAAGIQDYFGPDDLVYFELGDADDLADKILYVSREPDAVAQTIRRGQDIYHKHDWTRERGRLIRLFTQTLGLEQGSEIKVNAASGRGGE